MNCSVILTNKDKIMEHMKLVALRMSAHIEKWKSDGGWWRARVRCRISVKALSLTQPNDDSRESRKTLQKRKKKHSKESEGLSFNASCELVSHLFKPRANLHNVKVSEESNVDLAVAWEFPELLQEIIDEGGYLPEQVFSIDEIGPNGEGERLMPGYKATNSRLNLLFGVYAYSDMKLKSHLV